MMSYPNKYKKRIKFYNLWLEQFCNLNCFYCNIETSPHHEDGTHNKTTIDHLIPISRGGSDEWSNLVISCFRCNNLKKNLTLEEFIKTENCPCEFKKDEV